MIMFIVVQDKSWHVEISFFAILFFRKFLFPNIFAALFTFNMQIISIIIYELWKCESV